MADLYSDKRLNAMVTVSFGFTCGHSQRPSKPIHSIESVSHPGGVIICERCGEFTLVDRVTIRLVPDPEVLIELLAIGADLEDHFAAEILSRREKA